MVQQVSSLSGGWTGLTAAPASGAAELHRIDRVFVYAWTDWMGSLRVPAADLFSLIKKVNWTMVPRFERNHRVRKALSLIAEK